METVQPLSPPVLSKSGKKMQATATNAEMACCSPQNKKYDISTRQESQGFFAFTAAADSVA